MSLEAVGLAEGVGHFGGGVVGGAGQHLLPVGGVERHSSNYYRRNDRLPIHIISVMMIQTP